MQLYTADDVRRWESNFKNRLSSPESRQRWSTVARAHRMWAMIAAAGGKTDLAYGHFAAAARVYCRVYREALEGRREPPPLDDTAGLLMAVISGDRELIQEVAELHQELDRVAEPSARLLLARALRAAIAGDDLTVRWLLEKSDHLEPLEESYRRVLLAVADRDAAAFGVALERSVSEWLRLIEEQRLRGMPHAVGHAAAVAFVKLMRSRAGNAALLRLPPHIPDSLLVERPPAQVDDVYS